MELRMTRPVKLKFSDNYVFGVWCRKNPELCKHILEIALDIKIRDIVFVESEKHVDPGIHEHGIRVDVYAEDDENTIYDVEMQTVDNRNLPKRARYYQSAIDTDRLSPSTDYATLKKTIILFICCFDPFQRNLPRYRFQYRAEEDPSLLLGDETEKVFVNAKYVGELADGEFGSFIHFVATGESTSEFTYRISEAMDELNRSDEGRSLMTLEMAMQEEREYALKQGREQGLTEGREQGLTEGREQGLTEGREQGLTEGREQGLTEGREQGLTEGREQGLIEGREKGREMVVLEMLSEGDITMEIACMRLKISPEEGERLLAEYQKEKTDRRI